MYPWLVAAHVVAVLLFVGGTVALLLASTALGTRRAGEPDPAGALRAAVRRWDARVTAPAMVATWGLGLGVAVAGGWFASGWLQAKLLLVLLLSGTHGALAGRLRRFDPEALPASVRPPALLTATTLAGIVGTVALAIVKPG